MRRRPGKEKALKKGKGWQGTAARGLRSAAFAVILGLLLTGCGGRGSGIEAGDGEKAPTEKEQIICYYPQTNAYIAVLADMFNAQSTTTQVEARELDDDAYDGWIVDILRKGEEVDVIWIRQPSRSNQMAAAGLLYDLSDLVESSYLDISCYGQSLDIVQLDERIYSLPFVQNIWLLFYNKDVFDELSLEYPGQLTWEEYALLAKRIQGTTADGRLRWGGYIPTWVDNLGALELGEYLYADELPATEEFLSFKNRLYNVDCTHPRPEQMEAVYPSGYETFLDGETGMMINGDWTIQILRTMEKERAKNCRWDAAPLPAMEGAEEGTSVGSNSYLGVAASSSHPENAFEFLEFCCGEEGANILASRYCFSSYYTEGSREIYIQNVGMGQMEFFFNTILQNEEGKFLLYKDLRDLFDQEALSYLKEEKSLEEMMDDYLEKRRVLME